MLTRKNIFSSTASIVGTSAWQFNYYYYNNLSALFVNWNNNINIVGEFLSVKIISYAEHWLDDNSIIRNNPYVWYYSSCGGTARNFWTSQYRKMAEFVRVTSNPSINSGKFCQIIMYYRLKVSRGERLKAPVFQWWRVDDPSALRRRSNVLLWMWGVLISTKHWVICWPLCRIESRLSNGITIFSLMPKSNQVMVIPKTSTPSDYFTIPLGFNLKHR